MADALSYRSNGSKQPMRRLGILISIYSYLFVYVPRTAFLKIQPPVLQADATPYN